MNKESARTVMEALLPAIHRIDGGCDACIYEFVENANKALLQFGIELQDISKETYGAKVEVFEVKK